MGEHENWDDAVVVALGSNVAGDYGSLEHLLEAALKRFAAEGLKIVARSSWWRSAAWPDPAGPEYRNGVVLVETALEPSDVLAALHRIERQFGRERSERNAPRTLDLDLIAYGRRVAMNGDPILPHPRAAERRFVMGPLAEIAPHWRHPGSGRSAHSLAETASIGMDASPTVGRGE
jgi:2-amino-4-hydroxy-6-hydroxymethyldihydropteridine diphosphokinase